MNFLKNLFFSLLVVELLSLLTILTYKSWESLSTTNASLKALSAKSINYSSEVTLATIIQNEKAIEGLVEVMNKNEMSHFNSSPKFSFIDKAYQKNRYLPLAWLDDERPSGLDREIEENAKKFLGRRYVWGAVGPNCFDCSGFTMKVFRTAGINLPRVSRNQAKVGALVKFEELKRGDMVFFDTSKRPTGRVNHVGIYLEDGKFIHASSGNKRVVITSFDKKAFYKQRFLWGRRVLKNTIHYAFDTLPNRESLLKSSMVL